MLRVCLHAGYRVHPQNVPYLPVRRRIGAPHLEHEGSGDRGALFLPSRTLVLTGSRRCGVAHTLRTIKRNSPLPIHRTRRKAPTAYPTAVYQLISSPYLIQTPSPTATAKADLLRLYSHEVGTTGLFFFFSAASRRASQSIS